MDVAQRVLTKVRELRDQYKKSELENRDMKKTLHSIDENFDKINTHSPYLFNSPEEFLASPSWQGSHKIKIHHHFDQWLYIGAYHAFPRREIIKGSQLVKFKVGYSSNLQQRERSLNSDNHFDLSIVYSWPIPNAQVFETEIFRYLRYFIHGDALPQGRTIEKKEVIWSLNLEILIQIIRLILFKFVILKEFVPCSKEIKDKMKYTMLRSPRGFKYKDKFYHANLMTRTSIILENIFTEMNIPVILPHHMIPDDWGYTALDWLLTKDPYTDSLDNVLGLKKNDLTLGVYRSDGDGKQYPLKIIGFGVGPYAGFFYVQWLKYDENFEPTDPVEPYIGQDYPSKQFLLPEDICIGTGKFAWLDFKLRL